METLKIMKATLLGGIVFFISGALVYAVLLMDYLKANTNAALWRPEEDMLWGGLIANNLIWAFFISLIFSWAGVKTAGEGALKGFLCGLLCTLAMNIGLHSNTVYFNSLQPLLADTLASALMSGLAGAAIGQTLGKGKSNTREV